MGRAALGLLTRRWPRARRGGSPSTSVPVSLSRDRAPGGADRRRRVMPVVPTKQIVDRAFQERYGVAAINVVNDLTLEAVLAAAEELRAPLIVQTSVKTV